MKLMLLNLNQEVWKPVPEYEGMYEVSNYGRVRSLDREDSEGRKYKGKVLKIHKDLNGYMNVRLYKNGKSRKFKVHRLVGQAFLIIPSGAVEIHHKDNKRDNNHVSNLEWVTKSQNILYAYETGRMKKYKKLSDKDVDFIRKHYKPKDKKYGRKALANRFNVSISHIYNIVYNRNQAHGK